MPRAWLRLCAFVLLGLAAVPAGAAECADLWTVVAKGCRRIVDTYRQGSNEILLSGYAWHVPATWSPERRAELNSAAWGGGLARTVEEADGDTHTVFFLAFLDSHENVESQIGYAYHTYWGRRDSLQFGLGYTAMIAQRPDIWNGVPFPVVLPLAALRYGKGTLEATYIPTLAGSINHGSTFYLFGRVGLE
jgi:palmitoyl transferase